MALLLVLLISGGVQQTIKAESTVYFFIDFSFWNDHYDFKINGTKSFTLTPEARTGFFYQGGPTLYNMVARKVIFKNPGQYAISAEMNEPKTGKYDVTVNLNLEDGECYYVNINATLKKNVSMELISEKEGQKLLKKAMEKKKYTFNEDFIYEGK